MGVLSGWKSLSSSSSSCTGWVGWTSCGAKPRRCRSKGFPKSSSSVAEPHLYFWLSIFWGFVFYFVIYFVFSFKYILYFVFFSAENTCTLASLNFVLRIKLSLRVRWVLVVTWIILRNNLNVLKAEIYMAKVKEIIATELGSIAKVEIWWQLTSVQALLVCKHPGTGSFGSTAQVPWKIWLYHLSCEAFLWGKNMILHLVWC